MRARLICSQWMCVAVVVAVSSLSGAQSTANQENQWMGIESHIGNLTGHAANAKDDYRRYCVGCHGDLGDGQGENAVWLDPKPRDFTIAQFKCRSTPTGTLPTDEDLFNTIARGLDNSNMPPWNTFTKVQRADLVAYIKHFSAKWQTEKPGTPIRFHPSPKLRRIESRPVRCCLRSWNAGSATESKVEAMVHPPIRLRMT